MSKPHRIAASGLVFKDETVLLVRYRDNSRGTYLVGPGGALEDDENIPQAIIREVKEETGVTVRPDRVVLVEDLVCSRFKMIKVWVICDVVSGAVRATEEARKEGIIEAGWYSRRQLDHEVVFPSVLVEHDWNALQSDAWEVTCLPTRQANF